MQFIHRDECEFIFNFLKLDYFIIDKLLKGNMQDQSVTYILGLAGFGLALFQIGSLCLIGQWLSTKSDDVFDATYNCKWFDQSKSFKKSLMIMRTACQRQIEIGFVNFDFSYESFFNVSYYFFYVKALM